MLNTLVFYGSYRRDRAGIRLARYVTEALSGRGHATELIEAEAVGLPMLDRMFKEYAPGEAPLAMAKLAVKIRAADAFVFVVGEYNWGVQPGLKNLTDHYLAGRVVLAASRDRQLLGRANRRCTFGPDLARLAVGDGYGRRVQHRDGWTGLHSARRRRSSDRTGGDALARSFPRFAADLEWWAEAGQRQRAERTPPY